MNTTRDYAKQLDAKDPIFHFRDRFVINDPSLIYLDGNSLGRLPKATQSAMAKLLDDWGERLIRMWGDGYFTLPQRVGGKVARLLGAQEHEVVIAESTSVNLFKLVIAALTARPGRRKIITDDLNFPSDLYILQGISRLLGEQYEIVMVPSLDGIHGSTQQLLREIDEHTALITLSHTVFKSAFVYNMAEINRVAHEAGALTLWDLSHSIGSVEVKLNETAADLAIGCTYKYVNGGPGSPAFLFVREALHGELKNPITGWMGQQNMFDFELTYKPVDGIEHFMTGTPTVASLLPIDVGLDILVDAGMDQVRQKSVRQTEYLLFMIDELLLPFGFTIKSPRDSGERGSHVSLGHPEGWRINQCMIQEMKIIPDFRAPDNIRLGVAPLYTTYEDLYTAVTRMRHIMENRHYEKYSDERTTVT